MRKLLLPLLLLSVVLAGCSSNTTTPTSTMTTDQLFAKKQECAGYYNQVVQETKNNRGKYAKNYSIDEIFYSQKRNTCI